MVVPVFNTGTGMTVDWTTSEWVASYQIYGFTAHSVFMQRVLKRKLSGLPPAKIQVGPGALTPPGLLCTNVFGASQFSPANRDKLSRDFPFQAAGAPNVSTAGIFAGGAGPRSFPTAALPVSEVQLVTEAARDRKASIAGVSRILGGVADKIIGLLGATQKIGGNIHVAITDQRLSRTLKGLAIYSAKNLEKAMEFHFVTGEPKISTTGEAGWAHIGLFQPWSTTVGIMKVFVDCNQLAHALDNMAEFFDQMFQVTHFTGWIAPLSASLKSNADISLKQVPIDFVVDRVSAALASLAIFVVSPEAACQNEADFLTAAAQCLALDTEKVARDCQRAQMADRTLTEFKQHGCSNPAALKPVADKTAKVVAGATDVDKTKEKAKRKREEKATRTVTAQTAAGGSNGGSKTPRGLCFAFACKFFSVLNHKGCTYNPCHSEHPSTWSLPMADAEKDRIKGLCATMMNVNLRDKLIQAITDA